MKLISCSEDGRRQQQRRSESSDGEYVSCYGVGNIWG